MPRPPLFTDIEPPDFRDPLSINRYTHACLGVALAQVMSDPSLNETDRRKQLAEIAGRMAPLVPQSVIKAAADLGAGVKSAQDRAGPPMRPKSKPPAQVSSDGPTNKGRDAAPSGGAAFRGAPPK